ncbi:putative integral membrane protein [Scedosporium apiospermum]|uniref:Putative integral membrane protein n=1 Tax=Pseudallescheria apiosperma TaxID=563466 RepID=A0A084G097_PSEDA|nr:putative integral membrane protein [Scedosporium apiospermum]KEZ40759.1 putative integral membrane protein [Scedosporium apiospermum]
MAFSYILPRHDLTPNYLFPRQENNTDVSSDPGLPPPMTPEEIAAAPHPNFGPKLVTSIWVLIGLSAAFLALRLYCKFSRHRGTWWDDYLLIGAWVCITAESACLTYATTLGYGKFWYDWSPIYEEVITMVKLINSAGSLSLTAAIWSKTSFALTLLRLTEGKIKWLIWFIIISMNIAMGLSALFVWIQCTPLPRVWDRLVPGTCWEAHVLPNYNIFSASYSAAMDITLALLPWRLIWGLQMKMKEKIGVAVAMSCGVFAGITAIIKTTKIPAMASADPGPGVDLFVWGNAESCVTIIAACIPILRVLIRDVKTSAGRYYLSNGRTGAGHSTHHQSKNRDNSNTITITGGRKDNGYYKAEDERELTRESNGKIMQTKEVAIEYQSADNWTEEHELDDLQRRPRS